MSGSSAIKRPRRQHVQCRSFVLICVLVIVGSAVLVATAMLFLAQSEAAVASGSADAVQTRALAWSGVQAAMAGLHDQRGKILMGERPTIPNQMVIFEDAGVVGEARLLPLTPEGGTLAALAGRLDVNWLDADSLARTGMADLALASAIIEARDLMPGGAVQSVGDLLERARGVLTAEQMYGPLDSFVVESAQLVSPSIPNSRSSPRGLDDVLTTFTAEPELQRDGAARLNVNRAWADELESQVRQQAGEEAAQALKLFVHAGGRLERLEHVVKALNAARVPSDLWPRVLDSLTVSSESIMSGRLDINSASSEALQSLPAMTPEQAAQMVSVREELSPEERACTTWPLTRGIIPVDQFAMLVDRITTRSWCCGLRIEAGTRPSDQEEAVLANRMILDVVIDLSAGRPRVAYLRDVTMLEGSVRYAVSVTTAEPEFESGAPRQPGAMTGTATQPETTTAPASAPRGSAGKGNGPVGRWLVPR